MDCLICQEDIIRTGYGISIECGHVFHGKCILEWMDSNRTCPICRTNFTCNSIHPLFLTNSSENDEDYKFEIERCERRESTIYIIPIEVEQTRVVRTTNQRSSRRQPPPPVRPFNCCCGFVIITFVTFLVIMSFLFLANKLDPFN